jgi:hypothetical protein
MAKFQITLQEIWERVVVIEAEDMTQAKKTIIGLSTKGVITQDTTGFIKTLNKTIRIIPLT